MKCIVLKAFLHKGNVIIPGKIVELSRDEYESLVESKAVELYGEKKELKFPFNSKEEKFAKKTK